MKRLFRKIYLAILKAIAASPFLAALSKPSLNVGRAVTIQARSKTLPTPEFWARIKSALTIPEPGTNPQAGYTRIAALLIAGIVTIVGLLVLFIYIMPEVYTQSANMTTVYTNAGAPAAAVPWWPRIMWFLIILTVLGIGFAIVKGRKPTGA